MAHIVHKRDDLVLCLLVQAKIADDSALPHLGTLQFKLRFDERHNYAAGLQQGERVREDQGQGNEGNVNYANINELGN